MSHLAFIFPGQASQYAGMGRDLGENFAEAREVFDEADRALGFSLSKLCFDGPEEELKLTENTQPAILAVSTAAFRVLEARSVLPDYVAGHSLGEYSALVAAGALDFRAALRLVRQRGRYMQEAVPAGEGAMAAIMGLAPALVADICQRAANGHGENGHGGESGVVAPANLNSPMQTVISGSAGAVKRAVELASAAGAKRAVMLPVSAPFHGELMRPAQLQLENDLQAATFSDLRFPLITNVDGEEIRTGDEARRALIRQVSLPVLWENSMRELLEQGVTTFVEVGPGKVLCGLMRQIERSVHCYGAEDSTSLNAAVLKLLQPADEAEA